MRKPRQPLTDQDRADWASFARLIRPLPGRVQSVVAVQPVMPVAAVRAVEPAEPRPPKPKLLYRAIEPVSVDARPVGLDTNSWKRFTAGKITVQARLDLHGSNADQACRRLLNFIQQAHATGLRCVEIITGLGQGAGGVIRNELPFWLSRPDCAPYILAATHDHARNHGSVRVLLRRRG